LPPLSFEPAYIEELRRSLPELPAARRVRLVAVADIPESDAALLTRELDVASFFERVLGAGGEAKPAANWIIGEILPAYDGRLPGEADFAGLVNGVQSGAVKRDQGRVIMVRILR